jgi:hypothetical protein
MRDETDGGILRDRRLDRLRSARLVGIKVPLTQEIPTGMT